MEAAKPARPSSAPWRRHVRILLGVGALVAALSILFITEVFGTDPDSMFTMAELKWDIVKMLWIAFAGAAAVSTIGLAARPRGLAVLLPYAVGLATLPVTFHLLDKIY